MSFPSLSVVEVGVGHASSLQFGGGYTNSDAAPAGRDWSPSLHISFPPAPSEGGKDGC